ncbi:MAG TPA: serine hydrolase [Pyrinomonadaceae bacterium]|jgi:CubicO group peptidase (beta-lactamase class C family)|nr:serine hydrolase [Pyrinomonadaceae bacterium]
MRNFGLTGGRASGPALALILFIVGLGLVGHPNASGRQQKGELEGLSPYVKGLLERLPVTPGLAVAVVRGDRIVYAEGFGRRDLKANLPVTPQTQFYIASTTKSFTATAVKLLADEGKLDLDAPIKKYFPDLALKPPLSAEQISLRDLLTHRSGIDNEPITFRTAYTGQYDADLILKLLADYSRPVSPEYRYSNLGYVVAGYAVEKATGETWQRAVERKVLDPLGLTSTSCFASKAKAGGNLALPYRAENGGFTELPYKEDNTMHAAGGIVSSAEDLAKWIIVNMNGGRLGGKQVIPAAAVEEILSPQINQRRSFYKFKRYAYGLGWNIGTYDGEKLIHCFGEFPGFRPHVSFMPEHKIGVVVLANESADASPLTDLIACDIYDHLLGKKPLRAEPNPLVDEFIANMKREREARAKRTTPPAASPAAPTLELKDYAGVYDNPEWGRLVVAFDSGSLSVKFGNLSSPLTHLSGDAFEARLKLVNPARLTFKADPAAGASGLNMMGQTFTKLRPAP